MVFLKEFFEKIDFEENQETTKSMKNYPVGKELDRNLPLSTNRDDIFLISLKIAFKCTALKILVLSLMCNVILKICICSYLVG